MQPKHPAYIYIFSSPSILFEKMLAESVARIRKKTNDCEERKRFFHFIHEPYCETQSIPGIIQTSVCVDAIFRLSYHTTAVHDATKGQACRQAYIHACFQFVKGGIRV